MKKRKIFVLAAILLALTLIAAGCAKEDPKALAKQYYDLSLEAISLGNLISSSKQAEWETKLKAIDDKVSKLSEEDKKIYNEELIKLGINDLGNVLGGVGDFLESAVEGVGDLLESAKGLLDLFN